MPENSQLESVKRDLICIESMIDVEFSTVEEQNECFAALNRLSVAMTGKTVEQLRAENQAVIDKEPVFLTSEKEPVRSDATDDGYVAAWDEELKIWGVRKWYDFPSHPGWSPRQRSDILRRWSKWRRIVNQHAEAQVSQA